MPSTYMYKLLQIWKEGGLLYSYLFLMVNRKEVFSLTSGHITIMDLEIRNYKHLINTLSYARHTSTNAACDRTKCIHIQCTTITTYLLTPLRLVMSVI